MDWLLILLVAAGAAAASRVFIGVRKARRTQTESWDDKVIERLRAMGSDPFSPHDVDFFFALPSERAAQDLRTRLEADGFSVDTRAVPDNAEHPVSLHASKSLRLSAPEMRELSKRFTQLAREVGGNYDGWTAGVVGRRS